jgi:hypothetical protein
LGADLWQESDLAETLMTIHSDLTMLDVGKEDAVKKMLNRILMLPPERQNLIFHVFHAFLELVITEQRKAGRHDEGRCLLSPKPRSTRALKGLRPLQVWWI